MKRILIPLAVLLAGGVLALAIIVPYFSATADRDVPEDGREPDLPPRSSGIDKIEYMLRRAEGIGLKRGIDKDKAVDPKVRQRAIEQMEQQEAAVAARPGSSEKEALLAPWEPIGPAPIPNGQVVSGLQTPVSGRVTSIAVHPTNPNIVYVGTAQGGLYRSTDGGAVWTALMDNALSLAIGSVAIAPSQPETVYVGTGEANFSSDSFFGVGVYRIDNASSASPVVRGPFNRDDRPPGGDTFSGRAISKIVVDHTDPATIYVGTAFGIGGIGGFSSGVLSPPNAGVYRSRDATSDNPSFRQIFPLPPLASSLNIRDIVLDPLNVDLMVVSVADTGGNGGLYWSQQHRSLLNNPLFNRTFAFNGGPNDVTAELAIHHTSAPDPPTIYAATGNGGGRILRSTDHDVFPPFPPGGGFTWQAEPVNSFCGPQCSYNIGVAVDPTNPARVYLGGVTLTFGVSTNSGASFAAREDDLHTDTHAIAVARSQPATIYLGTDGGIYKSTNSGATWTSLNNEFFSATQFMSVAVHPSDPNFTIGGTQDNGTNFYQPQGAWIRADAGDGGYAVIDQNAVDTTNVRMYHTYDNSPTGRAGYAFKPNTTSNTWTPIGCYREVPGGPFISHNQINCGEPVLFYAPLARGPGDPNRIYFATDRLYRSPDGGTTHFVSDPPQPGVPISAIGISPQDNAVRIVGLSNGGIFGTAAGLNQLSILDGGQVPDAFIARAVVDPNNADVAYVTLSRFGAPGAANVWRTSNLLAINQAITPSWTAASGPGTGAAALPPVPVSAFLVDPANSATLYAGTDMGVYISTNSGQTWAPFGTGLPRVAVFDMAITGNRVLRIATHGKGMYDMPLGGEAPRNISINDVSANEGNAGTTAFNFTVSLSAASTQSVTVNFTTANGTATAGSDYAANSGSVTFNPGETSKTVTVQVTGDTVSEPNETFSIILSGAVNGTVADGTGVGTIVDDDQAALSISDVTLTEGNTGTKAFNFNVTLSRAAAQTVTVNFATANGSAVSGSDYVANNGSVSFSPGETSKTVTVTVNGDSDVEPNETFFVNLSGAVNASIADNQGQGTIQNDDFSTPGFSVNDVSMNEGNSGTTAFTFTVNLTPVSSQPVTVNYATANGSATAPSDYVAVGPTLLTFGAGVASQQVTVLVNGDTTIEPAETFTVNLSNPSNAALSDPTGLGTIQNDDGAQPAISINDISLNEGNTGTTPFNFTVTLSAPASQTVTVSYATASGTALFPVDFNNIAATTLTFNPNETSKQVQVNVNGDTQIEPNETFFVNLSGPTNATIADNQGMATILNDDGCSYEINPPSQSFGSNGGTGTVQVITQPGCAWTAVVNPPTSVGDLSIFDLPERIDVFSDPRAGRNLRLPVSGRSPTEVGASNASLDPSPEVVFQGTGVGAIPDGLSGTPPQYGAPRVISFNVSGITGPITALSPSVTLTHTWAGDVDMVLRSPNGTASLITVSRIGATTADEFGFSSDYSGAYSFSDNASGPNIWTAANNSPIPAGTYRTTGGGGPGQTNPPPVTSLLSTFGALTSAQINGTWTLTVRDGAADDTGTVTAASLDITGSTGGGGNFITINSGASGNGNGAINYTVAQNTGTSARSGAITLTGALGETAVHSVTQAGVGGPNPTPTPTAMPTPTLTPTPTPGGGNLTQSFTGPAVAIPDNNAAGINIVLPVTSAGTIGDLNIRFDGTSPSADPTSTTVGVNHSWLGDLVFKLTSPAGTTVTIFNRPGGGNCSGNNLFNLTLDDEGGFEPVDEECPPGDGSGPFTGSFAPSTPLSAFDGQGVSGNWTLNVSDNANADLGSARAFSLIFAVTGGPGPTPTPTPGARFVAFDYDADGRADISIFRESLGDWYLQGSTAGFSAFRFGFGSDRIVPADYDGDRRTDIAVYRPSQGMWFILNTQTLTVSSFQFGLADDLPTPADFDGDGKADIGIYRPSNGTWFRTNSSNGQFVAFPFGLASDKPAAQDFDGDGRADYAVYRPSNGIWFQQLSATNTFYGEGFGAVGDQIVPGDYDGDRKTDLAVYRASIGTWFIKSSVTGNFAATAFGNSTDIPAPADFDGDGKFDICVFRGSDGLWFRMNSSNGAFDAFPFGLPGDRPTQNAFN